MAYVRGGGRGSCTTTTSAPFAHRGANTYRDGRRCMAVGGMCICWSWCALCNLMRSPGAARTTAVCTCGPAASSLNCWCNTRCRALQRKRRSQQGIHSVPHIPYRRDQVTGGRLSVWSVVQSRCAADHLEQPFTIQDCCCAVVVLLWCCHSITLPACFHQRGQAGAFVGSGALQHNKTVSFSACCMRLPGCRCTPPGWRHVGAAPMLLRMHLGALPAAPCPSAQPPEL